MKPGILVIYKEPGYTSHDVVAKLRHILHTRKIGHTGTLDPAAEGVLPVCIGSATKVCDLLTDHDKTYQARLLLGVRTDTQDTEGETLEERPVECTEAEVKEAIMSFVGDYDQIPPMYSALKVNGQKLYDLARAGKTVERQPRRVHIDEIIIDEIALPEVTMTVRCSKGTYIRTLCDDIGGKLGCGGAMKHLTRTRVGRFGLETAIRLSEAQAFADEGTVEDHILSTDSMFPELAGVKVREGYEKYLENGNPMNSDWLELIDGDVLTDRLRVYEREGRFAAVYARKNNTDRYAPEKMFPAQ